MFLRCPCGYILTSVACPGRVRHVLLTDHGVERLEDLVDGEVEARGVIGSWPEHFEGAGAIETWVCPKCLRMFLHAAGEAAKIVVYRHEATGLPEGSVGLDSQLGSHEDAMALGREQAGRSPFDERGR
jgi:hypothetical protein